MGNVRVVKQRVSEEVASSSLIAPYGFHHGGEPEVNMRLGITANLPDPRTDFAIEAICKMTPEAETYDWLSVAAKARNKKDANAQAAQAAKNALAEGHLKSKSDAKLFGEAISRLLQAYNSLRQGIFIAMTGKAELSWSQIKDYTTDISAVIGFLAGRYPLWKSWKWEQKIVYMVVGDASVLKTIAKDGNLKLPSKVAIKIGSEHVATWKRQYGAFKPFVTTAMRARLMLLGLILKILNIEQSSLLYFDLLRSASRWRSLQTEATSEIGGYGRQITDRIMRAFSEAKEGCLPLLSKGKGEIANYMALIMILGQALVDIDYTVHLEGLKEGIPLTWENYAVQVRYALILNEDIFEIGYSRELEVTWAMMGPKWEMGELSAPLAFPWLEGQLNACTVVSAPYDEAYDVDDSSKYGLGTSEDPEFKLDKVTVIPETLDLTTGTHYPWVGYDLTKAGWMVPTVAESYDTPTIAYLTNTDVPVTVGISRRAFSNSVFDVSIDVAFGTQMNQAIVDLFTDVPDSVMGVGRIFRDKGIIYRYVGKYPVYGDITKMMEGLPGFLKQLAGLEADVKEDTSQIPSSGVTSTEE
jgi:hypothetical protein